MQRTRLSAGFARSAKHIPDGSVQCRFFFVFGNNVPYTMLFELLALGIHQFKNTLAGQFGFATTFTEPNPCVLSEYHVIHHSLLSPHFAASAWHNSRYSSRP
jgi:hypothetical protein